MENMTFVIDFLGVWFLFQNSFRIFLKHRKNTTFMTSNSPCNNTSCAKINAKDEPVLNIRGPIYDNAQIKSSSTLNLF